MKRLAIPAILLFVVLPAFADSITLVGNTFGPNGNIVNVTMVPGQDVLLAGIRDVGGGSRLGWTIFYLGPITSLTWTFTVSNLQSPLTFDFQEILQICGIHPGDNCAAGHDFLVPTVFHPISGTLVVHFNDQVETFNFHYMSNAPEPATLLLFGTGLAAIGWRKHRRSSLA